MPVLADYKDMYQAFGIVTLSKDGFCAGNMLVNPTVSAVTSRRVESMNSFDIHSGYHVRNAPHCHSAPGEAQESSFFLFLTLFENSESDV